MNVEFLETVQAVLGWSTLINFFVLIWWFAWFALARDTVRRLHGRWFDLPDAQFDAIHYGGMAIPGLRHPAQPRSMPAIRHLRNDAGGASGVGSRYLLEKRSSTTAASERRKIAPASIRMLDGSISLPCRTINRASAVIAIRMGNTMVRPRPE